MSKSNALLVLLITLTSCGAGISDYIEDLPGGYQFVFESQDQQLILGHYSIPCTVLAYNYNDDYILAFQKPSEPCLENPVENVDIVQFWIIDIKQDISYGPLKISEYIKKREELKIPDKLKLKVEL